MHHSIDQSRRARTGKDAPVHGTVVAAPMIAGWAGVGAMPKPWYLSLRSSGVKASTADLAAAIARHWHRGLLLSSKTGFRAFKAATRVRIPLGTQDQTGSDQA